MALSFTKRGNTRKRLELGEGKVQALVLGRLLLTACETSKWKCQYSSSLNERRSEVSGMGVQSWKWLALGR